MSRLFQFNRRDCIGLACWLLASLAIGLWSLPLMAARELYQWRRYHRRVCGAIFIDKIA